MTLILPQRRTSQPQYQTGIDGGNPITNGLVFAWSPNCHTLGGTHTSETGYPTYATGIRGVTLDFTPGGYAYPTSLETPAVASGMGFLFIGGLPTTDYPVAAWSPSGSLRVLAGSLSILNNTGGTDQFTQCGIPSSYPPDSIIACTANAAKTLGRSVVNMVYAEDTASGGEASPPVNEVSIGQSKYGDRNTDTIWDTKISLVAQWGRELSTAELFSLSANPWQIFSPRLT